MKKKYIALISILSVFVIMAITAAILFFTKPPAAVDFDQALLEETFSGKIEFPANAILDNKRGLVFENGRFRAEIDSIGGRFYTQEEIENGILEQAMQMRDYEFQLGDGSRVACNDWFLIKPRWHFYAWRLWQEPKVENGMRYEGCFWYLKGNFHFGVTIRCTDPRDTENMKALYMYIVEYVQENTVDLQQWQKEHGYDLKE